MGNWSQLLPEVLSLICYRMELPDLFRFGAVCRNWQTAAFANKRNGSSRTSPWIMVWKGRKNQSSTAAIFFSLSENLRSYSIDPPLPGIGGCECVGSSHGWLVTVDSNSDTSLLNPITRRQICLPPSSTIRHIKPVTRNAEGQIIKYTVYPHSSGISISYCVIVDNVCHSIYKKAILLSSPDHDDKNCIVILLVSGSFQLAYTRLGDCCWSQVDDSEDMHILEDMPILDIVCHQGKIYTISHYNFSREFNLASWDFNGSSEPQRIGIISGEVPPELAGCCRRSRTSKYLVSSLWGDVLLVWVGFSKTKSILLEVYKVDLEKRELIQITSLRDHAIFIGQNSSICLSSCDFPWLKKNCIYFVLSASLGVEDGDVGIYDLNNGSVEILLLGDSPSKWASRPISDPIWFMPSLA